MRCLFAAALLVSAVGFPMIASAQAYRCAVPGEIAAPHPELPTSREPQRIVPTGGYTLAITWAPEACHGKADRADMAFECHSGNQFGFVLHGLWPDGQDKVWPQYCKPTEILSQDVLRRNLCSTPSAQLLQHEYAKHGTCTDDTPAQFFQHSTGLYGKLRYPKMQALSQRKDLTAGTLASAISDANPGMTADMMRITADREGWLEEVWFCLDTQLHYRVCPSFEHSLPPGTPIKIARAKR